jgi:Protein of unknown function DUF262
MINKSRFKERVEHIYDPEDVNIRIQHFRVVNLLEMLKINTLDIFDKDFEEINFWNNEEKQQINLFDEQIGEGDIIEIDESDDLQRNTALWNSVQKSRFIESLMIKIPIPAFYFDGSQNPWRVIDGLQRLHTIRSFVNNEFKLIGLEYLQKECNGLYYRDIEFPGYLKNRILNAEIISYVINPGTPNNVKHNIFKRINTGGLQLNGQEIRNAFFHGIAANFTKNLARSKEFLDATQNKVSPRRMIDREYANRFIAFQIFDYYEYNGKMDFFLSEAMNDLYDRSSQELSEIEDIFKKTMARIYQIFEGFGFYRPKGDSWGRQPNKAVFDTLSWNFSKISESEFNLIKENKILFIKKYRDIMNDELLLKAINDTTGSKIAVQNRFTKLITFFENFINDIND